MNRSIDEDYDCSIRFSCFIVAIYRTPYPEREWMYGRYPKIFTMLMIKRYLTN